MERGSSIRLGGITIPSMVFSSYGNKCYVCHLDSTLVIGGGGRVKEKLRERQNFIPNKGKEAKFLPQLRRIAK